MAPGSRCLRHPSRPASCDSSPDGAVAFRDRRLEVGLRVVGVVGRARGHGVASPGVRQASSVDKTGLKRADKPLMRNERIRRQFEKNRWKNNGAGWTPTPLILVRI